MNFEHPSKFINIHEYDYIVSLGDKCPTAMILRELKIYRESFPFDYFPTSPHLILKFLQNQDDFFPKKGENRTKDGILFTHFNTTDKYCETIETFKRRFERLFNILQNNKKILFVYTSESSIYNHLNNRYNDNYSDLKKIVEYITVTYNYDNFKLICIHTNNSFVDTENMTNYRINVPDIYFSDNMKTHTKETYMPYRATLKQLFEKIFQL